MVVLWSTQQLRGPPLHCFPGPPSEGAAGHCCRLLPAQRGCVAQAEAGALGLQVPLARSQTHCSGDWPPQKGPVQPVSVQAAQLVNLPQCAA